VEREEREERPERHLGRVDDPDDHVDAVGDDRDVGPVVEAARDGVDEFDPHVRVFRDGGLGGADRQPDGRGARELRDAGGEALALEERGHEELGERGAYHVVDDVDGGRGGVTWPAAMEADYLESDDGGKLGRDRVVGTGVPKFPPSPLAFGQAQEVGGRRRIVESEPHGGREGPLDGDDLQLDLAFAAVLLHEGGDGSLVVRARLLGAIHPDDSLRAVQVEGSHGGARGVVTVPWGFAWHCACACVCGRSSEGDGVGAAYQERDVLADALVSELGAHSGERLVVEHVAQFAQLHVGSLAGFLLFLLILSHGLVLLCLLVLRLLVPGEVGGVFQALLR